MSGIARFLALVGLAGLFAGCSGPSSRTYFETEGLQVPSASCRIKPSTLGHAARISRIDEGNGCQVPDPWEVRSLGSVAFSQPATLNCGMAEPLADWLENVVQPTAQRVYGESVVSVDVAASYSCRPRNNKRGAKLSEHGFGNAIDISAFTLESGRKISVEDGYGFWSGDKRFLNRIREDACGRFHTVLGPGSDRHHHDHFHLDLQKRRSGNSYCS